MCDGLANYGSKLRILRMMLGVDVGLSAYRRLLRVILTNIPALLELTVEVEQGDMESQQQEQEGFGPYGWEKQTRLTRLSLGITLDLFDINDRNENIGDFLCGICSMPALEIFDLMLGTQKLSLYTFTRNIYSQMLMHDLEIRRMCTNFTERATSFWITIHAMPFWSSIRTTLNNIKCEFQDFDFVYNDRGLTASCCSDLVIN